MGKTERIHYYYFNFFRLLAALSVLTMHARCEFFATYLELSPDSQNLFTQLLFAVIGCFTQEGMCCFFLLSGFLVGGPMIERLVISAGASDRESECTDLFLAFSRRRFFRIIVPLGIAVCLVILVKSIAQIDYSLTDAMLNIFGLQGVLASDFGWIYWSLAYEIWFYVLIAAIVGLFAKNKIKILSIVLLLLSGFVFIKLPVFWFLVLLLGTGTYFLKNITIPKHILVLSIAGMGFAFFLRMLSNESHVIQLPLTDYVNHEMVKWGTAVLGALVMIYSCHQPPTGTLAKFAEKIGNKWAPMTYSLYITHFTVLEFYRYYFGQTKVVCTGSVLIYISLCMSCIVIAYAFYWLIEKKFVSFLLADKKQMPAK